MNVTYVEVPVYEPSSAKITIGDDPFYGASTESENIKVKRAGLPLTTIVAFIGIPVGLFLLWTFYKKD